MINNVSYSNDRGFLFFIAFIPWTIALSLYTNTYFIQFIPLRYIYVIRLFSLVVLFLREIFNNKFSMNTICMYAFLIFVLIICSKSNDFELFDMIFFACSCRNIKFKQVVSVYFICQLFVFSLTLFECYKGFLPNVIYVQGDRIRYSLGYGYATLASQAFFYLSASYIYIRGKKLKYVELLVVELVSILLFIQNDTKNPFFMTTFLVLVAAVLKQVHSKSEKIFKFKLIKFLSKYTFLVMSVISFVSAYFYRDDGSNFSIFINKMFSNRLTLSHSGLMNFGIPLLGQKVDFVGLVNTAFTAAKYDYIDSSYIQILVVRGVIFLIVLILLLSLVGRKIAHFCNENSIYLVIVFFAISVHSLFDPQLVDLWYNPFILVIGYVFNNSFFNKTEEWIWF